VAPADATPLVLLSCELAGMLAIGTGLYLIAAAQCSLLAQRKMMQYGLAAMLAALYKDYFAFSNDLFDSQTGLIKQAIAPSLFIIGYLFALYGQPKPEGEMASGLPAMTGVLRLQYLQMAGYGTALLVAPMKLATFAGLDATQLNSTLAQAVSIQLGLLCWHSATICMAGARSDEKSQKKLLQYGMIFWMMTAVMVARMAGFVTGDRTISMLFVVVCLANIGATVHACYYQWVYGIEWTKEPKKSSPQKAAKKSPTDSQKSRRNSVSSARSEQSMGWRSNSGLPEGLDGDGDGDVTINEAKAYIAKRFA